MNQESSSVALTIATVCWNLCKSGRTSSVRNCLESVRTQTFRDYEHLIVDGGSTDGTLDIIREYADSPRLKVVSEPDHGIYDAMNKAIRMARGKYIVFLNSDDALSDTGALAAVMKSLTGEDADFSFANVDVYDEGHTSFIRTWRSSIDDMPFGYYPCHQTVFCKTDVLRKIGGFTENYLANDNYLMLKLVARGYSCVYVDRTIVDFHTGGASASMVEDKTRMRSEHIEFFRKEIGERAGLSVKDCEWLYEQGFRGLPYAQALDLGAKLPLPRWIKRYYSVLLEQRLLTAPQSAGTSQARVRLMGKFPLIAADIPR